MYGVVSKLPVSARRVPSSAAESEVVVDADVRAVEALPLVLVLSPELVVVLGLLFVFF